MVMGYVLAQLLCFGSSVNCEIKPISTEIFTDKSACEWERERVSVYYPKDTTECAKVVRPDQDGWNQQP